MMDTLPALQRQGELHAAWLPRLEYVPPPSRHDPGWIAWPVPGCALELINEYFFYWLGERVGALDLLMEGMEPSQAMVLLYSAKQAADKFQGDIAIFPMCAEASARLNNTLAKTIEAFNHDVLHRTIEASDLLALHEDRKSFDDALSIQLHHFKTYRVTPKGPLDTEKLMAEAWLSFTPKHWGHLSDIAKSDWTAGARCLAFDLPTAAGFHILRAVEAVVKFYLGKIPVVPPRRDLGDYVRLLRDNSADPKATQAVDQIRSLHRNPLMHPEDTLDAEQGRELFSLCEGAIKALLRDMEKRGLL